MQANWGPIKTTLRGILRTEFRYGPPSYGMRPWEDSLETPTILSLTEPLVVLPDPPTGQEGDYYSQGFTVTEVQVAPNMEVDEAVAGAMVEISGELFPHHTGHHHRQVLIACTKLQVMAPFAYTTTPNARIFSTGSGVLLNGTGHVLTARHVARGQALSVRRRLDRSEARVIAFHPDLDLAILQAEIKCNHVVAQRSILGPALGERVYAAGYPVRRYLGHGVSFTEGVVSSERINSDGLFHFSAPIQPGNSGGPLFDSHGNLLAIIVKQAFPNGRPSPSDVRDIQLLNEAIPMVVLSDFLERNGVELEWSPFIHRIPAKAPPSTQIADIAEKTTLEVESWVAAPLNDTASNLTQFDLDSW